MLVGDNYNVTGSGTGFGLNAGVNSGINPPTTRLTGTAAATLRYMLTAVTKSNTAFTISGNKLQVSSAANPGRFSLSADGIVPFNWAAVLGTGSATPQNPMVYDLSISMVNNSAGNQRCSFALGTVEGDATTWDFGIQIFRTAASDNFYTIQKRIDTGSSGRTGGQTLISFITNTVPGTLGNRTDLPDPPSPDAGSETTTLQTRACKQSRWGWWRDLVIMTP